MTYGVTDDGFVIKRQSVIRTELETRIQAIFGAGILLDANEPMGQWIGILSEREAILWELAQAVYDAFYPDTAQEAQLSEVVTITGHERNDSTYSTVTLKCIGTIATVIPAGAIASVDGDSDKKFETLADGIIVAGTDEIQTIAFSGTPTIGNFQLVYDGEATANIGFGAVALDVQNALNALVGLSAVTVAGTFAGDFVVTFAGADGSQPQNLLTTLNNTLEDAGGALTIAVAETVAGDYAHIDIEARAIEKGAMTVYADTITVIETVIAGWSNVTNELDVTSGNDIETDAALRIRRTTSIQIGGAASVGAIYAHVVDIDAVTAARVFNNRTNVVDGSGRPPHSLEVVALGGTDDEIAEAMWPVIPAGIEMVGTTVVSITDSQGFSQDVKFNRPSEIDIYFDITITIDAALYPAATGEATIQAAVLAYAAANYGIGQDVITDWLFCPVNSVPGITNIVLKIGVAPAPATDANIVIADNELSAWDSTRITVTTV